MTLAMDSKTWTREFHGVSMSAVPSSEYQLLAQAGPSQTFSRLRRSSRSLLPCRLWATFALISPLTSSKVLTFIHPQPAHIGPYYPPASFSHR